ncbi:hypothetical protein ACFQ3Z_16035 [Streptomyces nogalater]
MAPDLVRDLIGKGAEPADQVGETVTMTGTPGALAQLIQKAGGRLVPDAPITKDADMADADLDPTVVLAEPEDSAPGDVSTPGSPAWEAVDAATARKWTSILSRAKSALGVMADRELLEAAAGDSDDFDSAMDLEDAACAIDYAISVLAPFAVDEEAEVVRGTAELDVVGKALGTFDAGHLDVIESLSRVAKAAGRCPRGTRPRSARRSSLCRRFSRPCQRRTPPTPRAAVRSPRRRPTCSRTPATPPRSSRPRPRPSTPSARPKATRARRRWSPSTTPRASWSGSSTRPRSPRFPAPTPPMSRRPRGPRRGAARR